MSSLAQLLLIVVISTLTFLITVVAIQVFKLLQDARMALQKFNRLLENTQTISESAARPIAAVNQFFSEVKTMVDNTQNEIVESTPDRVMNSQKSSVPSRRFFHRAGQMLRPTRPS